MEPQHIALCCAGLVVLILAIGHWVMHRRSGWSRMAERFRTKRRRRCRGQLVTVAGIGRVVEWATLYASSEPEGLLLQQSLPWSLFEPDLLIPWHCLSVDEDGTRGSQFGPDRVALFVAVEPPIQLGLPVGQVGDVAELRRRIQEQTSEIGAQSGE